jgi:hypothetical protein
MKLTKVPIILKEANANRWTGENCQYQVRTYDKLILVSLRRLDYK